jgi:molecular chaperone IbpA
MEAFPKLSLDRYLPSTLGFEHFFDILDRAADIVNTTNTTFPPVNVVAVDTNKWVIELAIAGYKNEEIDVSVEKNSLKIVGKKADKDERQYLAKGIAGRQFTRVFLLADTVVVNDAVLADGILSVSLENIVPEEQTARKVKVK